MTFDGAPSPAGKGLTLWMTGLPSAGKSTLARALVRIMMARGTKVFVLDGDEVRERLSKGLGFSKEDRDENILRIAYVARLLTEAGAFVVVAAISPYRAVRDKARAEIGRFVEVYVNCPVEECIKRDVKGLYRKALDGKIAHMTGISDPYEAPLHPELVLETSRETLDASAGHILSYLESIGYLPAGYAAAASGARVTSESVSAPV
jgi:adenylylsulfate kinase